MNFFCLTCEMETCADCILDVKDHKRHSFDRLDAVFFEKFPITNEKIAALELRMKIIEKHSKEAEKNLTLINVTEDSIMSELQTLFNAAKSEVNETVNKKRDELEKCIQLTAEQKASVTQLREEIEAISHFNFIKQQGILNTKCDELQEQFQNISSDFIDYYDIGCEIIPATKLTTYNLDYVNEVETLNLTVNDSAGDDWKMSFIKGELVYLTVAPNENVPFITSHKFKVTTEISHSDISKSLRKRFVIQRKMEKFLLGTVDQLISGGYLESGMMTFHIAIEPLNVVEAHDHYKDKAALLNNTLVHYKNLLIASKESCDTMKKDNDLLKKFSIGYYLLDYSSIQKQAKSCFVSPNIIDFNGNEWKMEIKFERNDLNKILLSTYILPARIITISENSRRCAYFIELMHSNPDETIRGFAENTFDDNDSARGWKGFIERTRVLNDVGFVRNGKISFRFGVCPTD